MRVIRLRFCIRNYYSDLGKYPPVTIPRTLLESKAPLLKASNPKAYNAYNSKL